MTGGLHIDGRPVPCRPGQSIFDAALAQGLALPASCPQSGACGECIVEVTRGAAALSPIDPTEQHLGDGFRLACQARLQAPASAVQVRTLRRRTLRIETAGVGAATTAAGDDAAGTGLGLALDIGTTTVVLRLLDRATGAVHAARAFENPQRFAGGDVIARIAYDQRDGAGRLRSTLYAFLAHELRTLPEVHRVTRIVVVGNPTMRDLFFGLDVSGLGVLPFRSRTEAALGATAGDLGLDLDTGVPAECEVYAPPLLGCHVGADVVAGLLAAGLAEPTADCWAYLDIGTNTELVMGAGSRILATSCPAGPAFEGGRIGCGMPAFEGAVEGVRIAPDGTVELRVIGPAGDPTGICGSGLVDCLAALRGSGRLDSLGRLPDGTDRFDLAAAHGIHVTERDIAELAQAKAAQAAGLVLLAARLGIRLDDLQRVYLAGAFGRHLDPAAAIAIGLLPAIPTDRIELLGNAAIEGAARILRAPADQATAEALATRVTHVALEAEPGFFECFADACRLQPLTTGSAATAAREAPA